MSETTRMTPVAVAHMHNLLLTIIDRLQINWTGFVFWIQINHDMNRKRSCVSCLLCLCATYFEVPRGLVRYRINIEIETSENLDFLSQNKKIIRLTLNSQLNDWHRLVQHFRFRTINYQLSTTVLVQINELKCLPVCVCAHEMQTIFSMRKHMHMHTIVGPSFPL